MGLSKSRFTSGLQCYRQLWWRTHEPDAPELTPDPSQQAIYDQGSNVGQVAREHVPGGVLIDLPHEAIDERVRATRHAVENGAPVIYEASFIGDDTFAAVDILERTGDCWRLVEVKSTTKVKPVHLPDVAIQLHVLRKSGLRVGSAQVMHLNRACAYPDLDDLFTRTDVTSEVEPLLADVPGEIGRQVSMLRGPLPEVPIGRHCDAPYECPFKGRCWPELPADHISTLYYIGNRWWNLAAQGCTTIPQVPVGFSLHAAAERQCRAIRGGAMVVEPGLGLALGSLRAPLAIIDVETVAPAIPVWNGCHPYDPVPAQFSCHVQDGGDGWTHHEWLADGPADPRPELVRRLASACKGAETILAYYSEYEARCLRLMVEALPELGRPVQSILERLRDALPIVRDHVYHLDFAGSFSLKAVLPALVPELGYKDMEIADGMAASRELERLVLDGEALPAAEQARLREALRRYCELDTWGVVRLLERLRELATAS